MSWIGYKQRTFCPVKSAGSLMQNEPYFVDIPMIDPWFYWNKKQGQRKGLHIQAICSLEGMCAHCLTWLGEAIHSYKQELELLDMF